MRAVEVIHSPRWKRVSGAFKYRLVVSAATIQQVLLFFCLSCRQETRSAFIGHVGRLDHVCPVFYIPHGRMEQTEKVICLQSVPRTAAPEIVILHYADRADVLLKQYHTSYAHKTLQKGTPYYIHLSLIMHSTTTPMGLF